MTRISRALPVAGHACPCSVAPMSGWAAATRAGWLVAQLGWMKLGPRPSPRVFATRLLPVVAFTAGSLYFGNVAYLSLSVAFIQILKARARIPIGLSVVSPCFLCVSILLMSRCALLTGVDAHG